VKIRAAWGNGSVRRLRFAEPVETAILSNHRRTAPFGVDGGESGKTSFNRIERTNSDAEKLSGWATITLKENDIFIIETSGGGVYG
jgi:5-oxoprolinase (ATP-hydrolysing)